MKPDARQLKAIAFAVAVFVSVAVMARSQPLASSSLANAIPTNQPTPQDTGPGTNQIVPLILMQDVPLSLAIENLARAAGINYLVDPRLTEWWALPDADGQTTHEPVITFRWENLTAKEALVRLLGEHRLVLAEDPITMVARVTYTNQIVSPAGASPPDNGTNKAVPIQFKDVPITLGLKNLGRAAGINFVLDPKIGYGQPDKNGEIQAEPILSFHWEKITPQQAFIALCENYDLIIVKDPASGVLLIRARDHPLTNFVDANLLGSDTNSTPLIQVQDAPLGDVLKTLVQRAHINVVLDPAALKHFDPAAKTSVPQPTVTIRWEGVTAKQAIAALCENYDLAIVKNSTTGAVQIKPKD